MCRAMRWRSKGRQWLVGDDGGQRGAVAAACSVQGRRGDGVGQAGARARQPSMQGALGLPRDLTDPPTSKSWCSARLRMSPVGRVHDGHPCAISREASSRSPASKSMLSSGTSITPHRCR